MQKPVLRTDGIHERFEEGDHIVFGDFFDFGDPGHVDSGLPADLGRGAARRPAGPLERGTGLQLDFQPDLILVFEIPNRLHFRSGVSVNHRNLRMQARGQRRRAGRKNLPSPPA